MLGQTSMGLFNYLYVIQQETISKTEINWIYRFRETVEDVVAPDQINFGRSRLTQSANAREIVELNKKAELKKLAQKRGFGTVPRCSVWKLGLAGMTFRQTSP